jgi:hypothetical protein
MIVLLLIPAGLFSDSGPNHRIKQKRPIRLGTSGGNTSDSSRQFCCSGTLGALVKDVGGTRYLLSNNHVLAKTNRGIIGQNISQPGLIDSNCVAPPANNVATLSTFVRIHFDAPNLIDAALAQVLSGKVNRFGRIIDIGRPGPPREAAIGMLVKKSGRTTGKTVGRIIAVNTSLKVEYPRTCGDTKGKNARFVDQFVIKSANNRHFSDGGDSGSLIVQRKRTCPATIGLLFAGDDSGTTTASRIQNVLSALGVSIVGCSSQTASDAGAETGSAPPGSADLNRFDSRIMHAEAIRSRHEDDLFRIPGVVGVGIGAATQNTSDIGIIVFVQRNSKAAATATALPSHLDQLPVRVVTTSGFRAF